ncbi:MAG TPA: DUF4384 domain-containing protein [Thiotrichaceae bacterium]|nr:DUF4384 domain-containing protein [Thiotrichaceae bacterium]
MENKENTLWKSLIKFIGLITTIGAAAFACYKTCYSDKECSFLEMDSLKFKVDYRYRTPCEKKFRSLQDDKINILRFEGDYEMEFTPKKKDDWLTTHLPNKENKYVYIFQIDNGKRIYRLIPTEHSVNQEDQSTPVVRVGTSYSLPVKPIDKNTGKTKIYFLSFKEPNEHLDGLYEALQNSSPATATHDRAHINLIDAVQSAWEEEGLFTTSVPVMTFKYREKPSCGYKESDHKESELHVDVKYSYRSKGDSDFKPLHDNAVLYSGDQYKIQFTPSEESYVYVFQMKTDNQQYKDIYTLFPCTEDVIIGNNPVSADTTYYLPNEDQHWILDDQLGMEKIYFLAFKSNHDLKPEYQQIDQACKQPDSENWVLKSLNLRDEGVFSNILTFKHEERRN